MIRFFHWLKESWLYDIHSHTGRSLEMVMQMVEKLWHILPTSCACTLGKQKTKTKGGVEWSGAQLHAALPLGYMFSLQSHIKLWWVYLPTLYAIYMVLFLLGILGGGGEGGHGGLLLLVPRYSDWDRWCHLHCHTILSTVLFYVYSINRTQLHIDVKRQKINFTLRLFVLQKTKRSDDVFKECSLIHHEMMWLGIISTHFTQQSLTFLQGAKLLCSIITTEIVMSRSFYSDFYKIPVKWNSQGNGTWD